METHVQKLTGITKLVIKYLKPDLYKKYKRVINEFRGRPIRQKERAAAAKLQPDYIFNERTPAIVHPLLDHQYTASVSFHHSGNCGDIIYSLPTVKELARNGKARMLLNINQAAKYENFHPLGNVMLNKTMADMLAPLLLHQPYIESCEIYEQGDFDYNLDTFRSYTFLLDRGSIARWYFHVFAISAPLYKPWLTAPVNADAKDAIIIARSHRYRNPHISYDFLSRYPKLLFIGVREEYDDMKLMIPSLVWRPVKDFLEMASLLNGCRLFIGNQSFPFSIAEGLKVNRLLEIYFRIPNVIPEGPGANDFIYQPQFEASVKRLYETPFS